ncbi:BQ2448_820 [Microbotryum intermedium]|uniref:BQ2448_820 protein n=1 Tax=Microbotryum intermedium TaxID=269621 RepID=A0A238F7G8_9BASI|nr:BQ2448_820 [Microbotryum intermedium]
MSNLLRRKRSQPATANVASDWAPRDDMLTHAAAAVAAAEAAAASSESRRFNERLLEAQPLGASRPRSWASSSSSSIHSAFIDSAYGTLDEAESSDDSISLWRKNTIKGTHRQHQQRSAQHAEADAAIVARLSDSVGDRGAMVDDGLARGTGFFAVNVARRGSGRRFSSGTRSRSMGTDDVFQWSQRHQLHEQRGRSSSLGRLGNEMDEYGSRLGSPRDSVFSLDDDEGMVSSTLYSQEHSFDSVEYFQSSSRSSYRSSPEPSEYEFDVARLTPARKRSKRLARASFESTASNNGKAALSRRHTLPRRRERGRAPSISITLVTGPTAGSTQTESILGTPSLLSLVELLPKPFPSLTTLAASLSIVLTLSSLLVPVPLLASSPVHILRARDHAVVEYINAFLSPLLVSGLKPAAALAIANFASLASIESKSSASMSRKALFVSTLWIAIMSLRVLLSYVFGRSLGWAHPQWFSTRAIHEVGAGSAPFLLSLSLIHAYAMRHRPSKSAVSPYQLALLAANFCTPIEQGGSGFWLGVSALAVAAIVCIGLLALDQRSTTRNTSNTAIKRRARLAATLGALCFIPCLAYLSGSSSPATVGAAMSLDETFSQLHPTQPHLLTILLMTAPRPGNPDFLLRTIESWLGGLPEPAKTTLSRSLTFGNFTMAPASHGRVRLLVYTHFTTHTMFDAAREYFTQSPTYARKASHYLQWYRDPRSANRLDQRLHVARGLHHAATDGGSSAYVMLAEDDFPLCPDQDTSRGQKWTSAWSELQRVLVATNAAMPDWPSADAGSVGESLNMAREEALSGHCGVFAATGGSGLAIRGFIAAKLPALLLGAHDPHGNDRDARASRGEFSIKHEDEGADTPDLVIQDCLRGRIPGCEVCSAPDSSAVTRPARRFPAGSARNPYGVSGDRWGKSGLVGTAQLLQRHLGYNASTLPGRKYGKEEWACGWRQPFNGEPDSYGTPYLFCRASAHPIVFPQCSGTPHSLQCFGTPTFASYYLSLSSSSFPRNLTLEILSSGLTVSRSERRIVELRILFFHSIWKLSRRRRFSSQPLEPITESELEELRGSIQGCTGRLASL